MGKKAARTPEAFCGATVNGDVAPQCAEDAPGCEDWRAVCNIFPSEVVGEKYASTSRSKFYAAQQQPQHTTHFVLLGSLPWAEFPLVGHHGGPEPILGLTCHKDLLFLPSFLS